MKKKFKILACTLLLIIPCMIIFTGCEKGGSYTSISDYEYSKLVLESGCEYFENYGIYENFGDMTISSTYSYVNEEIESLTYKENSTDEEYVTKDFTITLDTQAEQSIIIYNVGEGESADIYMQITFYQSYSEKGYRVSETDETLESYEETLNKTITHTLIKDGEEYKHFTSEIGKEEGDIEETTEKSYHVYSTRDEYIEVFETLLTSINQETILNAFYPSNDIQYFLFADRNSYQDGNKFGSIIEYALTSFESDYSAGLVYEKMSIDFKDNLPSHLKANIELDYVTSYMNSSSEVNISYTPNTVNKPADFSAYELDDSKQDIYFAGAIIMPGE